MSHVQCFIHRLKQASQDPKHVPILLFNSIQIQHPKKRAFLALHQAFKRLTTRFNPTICGNSQLLEPILYIYVALATNYSYQKSGVLALNLSFCLVYLPQSRLLEKEVCEIQSNKADRFPK